MSREKGVLTVKELPKSLRRPAPKWSMSFLMKVGIMACFIQNPKLSVLITCLVEGAIQGVTNSGNVKSALGLAKSRLGYNM